MTAARWAAVAVLLAAAALRAPLLVGNRFHPDEALYASFGRLVASGRDPLLASVLVDKPPLGLYLYAGSLSLFGASEFAARLPGFAAGLLSVALTYRLGRRMHSSGAAWAASALLALSPLSILFAATLFLDTLLAAFVLWGWVAAVEGRARWAGVALGLALLVKQSAALFLAPAILLAVVGRQSPVASSQSPVASCQLPATSHQRPITNHPSPMRLVELLLLALGLASLAFVWDSARGAPVGFWAQGYADNMPGRLIRSAEVWPRLRAWGELLSYLTASPVAWLLGVCGIGWLARGALRRPAQAPNAAGLILLTFCLAYLGGYWLLAFNVWDRYLVALAPLLFVLAGGGMAPMLESAARRWPARWPRLTARAVRRAPALLLVLLMLGPALNAARSRYPIGGDHGAYDGIDEMARFIQTLPEGSVLYDHWLSWQWNFYLYDSPVYLAWMPSPGALAEDLQAFGRGATPRYIVVPAWETAAEFRSAAESAGFAFEPVHSTPHRAGHPAFTLFRLLATGD